MPQILRDEVAAGELGIGIAQPPGHGARNLALVDEGAVDRAHRAEAEAGGGEEGLLGGIGVVEIDILLGQGRPSFFASSITVARLMPGRTKRSRGVSSLPSRTRKMLEPMPSARLPPWSSSTAQASGLSARAS